MLQYLRNFRKSDTKRARKNSEFFFRETTWLRHKKNEIKMKPRKKKIQGILQLKQPTSNIE